MLKGHFVILFTNIKNVLAHLESKAWGKSDQTTVPWFLDSWGRMEKERKGMEK